MISILFFFNTVGLEYFETSAKENKSCFYIFNTVGLEFFETSAKENINVNMVFERLVDLICDKMAKSLDANTTVLNNPQTKRLTEDVKPIISASQCQQC